jgi:hypothetical protein
MKKINGPYLMFALTAEIKSRNRISRFGVFVVIVHETHETPIPDSLMKPLLLFMGTYPPCNFRRSDGCRKLCTKSNGSRCVHSLISIIHLSELVFCLPVIFNVVLAINDKLTLPVQHANDLLYILPVKHLPTRTSSLMSQDGRCRVSSGL